MVSRYTIKYNFDNLLASPWGFACTSCPTVGHLPPHQNKMSNANVGAGDMGGFGIDKAKEPKITAFHSYKPPFTVKQ